MTIIKTNTKLKLEGRGKIILRPSDYLSGGGEASVYKKADTIIKIYTNQDRVKQEDLPGKVKALQVLQHKGIIIPEGMVLLGANCVGCYMPFARGEAMASVFTNDFRKRAGFDDKSASYLVEKMREIFIFAHQKNALLADANEMNWLVDILQIKKPFPYLIDVDSCQIGRWKAKAIMPSIYDWHSKIFSEESDWFAWAIVTFQIYVGIHPYKGNLPSYKRGDLAKRMRDKASVFSPGVRLNRAVRDFNRIPASLLDWYKEVFEGNERSVPPSPFAQNNKTPSRICVKRVVGRAQSNLLFNRILNFEQEEFFEFFSCGLLLFLSGKLADLRSGRILLDDCAPGAKVIDCGDAWLCVDYWQGKWRFCAIDKNTFAVEKLFLDFKFKSVFLADNRLFLVDEQKITELLFKDFGKKFLTFGKSWSVAKSFKAFDGVGAQNILGASYVFVPFGKNSCAQIRVPELDDLFIINAKANYRFATFTAMEKKGAYHKLELFFDKNFQSYKLWRAKSDTSDLNIAILPKGVCATIVEDGRLDIFVPANQNLNRVYDKDIYTDTKLLNWENKVLCIKNNALWQVSVKQN